MVKDDRSVKCIDSRFSYRLLPVTTIYFFLSLLVLRLTSSHNSKGIYTK